MCFALLAACGATSKKAVSTPFAGTSSTAAPIGPAGVAPSIEESRAVSYHSVKELRAASTAVIAVTAETNHASGLATGPTTIPLTITTVTIDKVQWGTMPSTTVDIRQLGGVGTVSDESTPLLVIGQQYLLFVTPFELVHGQPSTGGGQYVITGDQGAYQLSVGTYKIISHIDSGLLGGGMSLPAEISQASAATTVQN